MLYQVWSTSINVFLSYLADKWTQTNCRDTDAHAGYLLCHRDHYFDNSTAWLSVPQRIYNTSFYTRPISSDPLSCITAVCPETDH